MRWTTISSPALRGKNHASTGNVQVLQKTKITIACGNPGRRIGNGIIGDKYAGIRMKLPNDDPLGRSRMGLDFEPARVSFRPRLIERCTQLQLYGLAVPGPGERRAALAIKNPYAMGADGGKRHRRPPGPVCDRPSFRAVDARLIVGRGLIGVIGKRSIGRRTIQSSAHVAELSGAVRERDWPASLHALPIPPICTRRALLWLR